MKIPRWMKPGATAWIGYLSPDRGVIHVFSSKIQTVSDIVSYGYVTLRRPIGPKGQTRRNFHPAAVYPTQYAALVALEATCLARSSDLRALAAKITAREVTPHLRTAEVCEKLAADANKRAAAAKRQAVRT